MLNFYSDGSELLLLITQKRRLTRPEVAFPIPLLMRLTASLLTGRSALRWPTDRPDLDPLMAATLRGPAHLYFGLACHLPVPSIGSTRRPTQSLGSHDSPILPQGSPFRVWTEEPSRGLQEWEVERLLVRKALQKVSRQREVRQSRNDQES